MERLHPPPPKRPVIAAVAACAVALLAGCSAASPAAGAPSAVPSHSPRAATAFTVAGNRPVLPSGSQDTDTRTPGTTCDSATLTIDKALGTRIADGFRLTGYSASAYLLLHFLQGTGTGVDYRAGSAVSKLANASSAFKTVNNDVQEMILRQLKTGSTRVRLSAAQLPTVAFESASSDLYWGFRGTQGLTVTGSGSRENGRFTGALTYVIRDSYGFPADDTLDGFGPPMRYLQTVCGAPRHAGGAHWFPDTITVTVPFNQPA
jgi:hypothetical protein